jgi:uncharacterized protein
MGYVLKMKWGGDAFKMNNLQLSNRQARQFLLLKHGLIGPYKFTSEQGVCDYIQQAGCIQYDPIDVCGKNAELVLQSRVHEFSKDMLYKLLYVDRKLVDYFDKNMSIIRIDDWKFFSRKRAAYAEASKSMDQVNLVSERVKQTIREKGYVSAREISLKEKVNWAWNAATLARAALETMYFQGELIVHHKKGTIKHYALTSDHIPEETLAARDPNETEEKHWEWRILRRIGAIGLLWDKPSDAWLGIDGLKSPMRKRIIGKLHAENKLMKVNITGIPDSLYCLTEDQSLMVDLFNSKRFACRTEFIAPLDNLLWDRKLISRLFSFDYKWEIYTPERHRKYGYYTLPILWCDQFIGRIEAVKNSKKKQLIIRNIWFEEDIDWKSVESDLYDCIERFKTFNQCEYISYECGWLQGK